MFDPKKFTTPTAKPLPVVLLLDVSYSMSGDKIENLNKAVEDMLDTFAQEEKMETEILVSVITFGGQVDLHVPFTKASQVQWHGLQVNGDTPMGTALKMAKAMIEDKETTPSRAYRPTIVLVSDGQPTDGSTWKQALDDFISEGRSSKCDRMAMAIGRDADETVLKRFIEGTPYDLFYAENAGQLHEFFQRVTMSVTMRTQSKNPNVVPAPSEIKLDGGSVKSAATGNTKGSSNDEEGYW
jgi:uncharacterized protein YegL